MNDTDKRKTLYDEIFNESSAPEVTNNNGVKEIKDAIDNKKFNENDMVALEDIFVFNDGKDSKTKDIDNKTSSLDSDDGCLMEDAKYFDLINNTLVDLRLNLEDVNHNEAPLSDVNLNNLIKKDNEVSYDEIRPFVVNDTSNDKANNTDLENSSVIKVEIPKKDAGKKMPFWVNYAFVVALVAISIIGSLTFLMKQFMR